MAEEIYDSLVRDKIEGRKPRLSARMVKALIELIETKKEVVA